MDNILDTRFPDPKTISPAALPKPPTSKVPTANDLDRKRNYAIAPPHYKSDKLDYMTTLPPSPKDNIDNNPACVNCNKYPNRPFKRGKCYMLYSPSQNIWGPVCGDGGYNANWVRGNRFGVNYEYDKVFKRKNFGINVPRFIKKNPVLVSDSPYFPIPDYWVRFNPKYKSYPYVNNYTGTLVNLNKAENEKYPKGYPTMTFPYSPLGNNTQTTVSEGFTNMDQNNMNLVMTMIVLAILIFIGLRFVRF